jgi:hypothetical protein
LDEDLLGINGQRDQFPFGILRIKSDPNNIRFDFVVWPIVEITVEIDFLL